MSFFKNRSIAIASMHQKEKVLAPFIEQQLQAKAIVPIINTDSLGTFSGEVERVLSPIETALQKCELAMAAAQTDIAIANEGSFGPHPSYYFIPADEEWLVLYDKQNNLKIVAKHISTKTNFSAITAKHWHEVESFAQQIGFPEHKLILKASETDTQHITKNIATWLQLNEQAVAYIKQYGSCFIQTDMRAMHNPTRMQVIAEAVQVLWKKIEHACSNCQTPGLELVEKILGLPCCNCGTETEYAKSYIYQCQKCLQQTITPSEKTCIDPMYCPFCNP